MTEPSELARNISIAVLGTDKLAPIVSTAGLADLEARLVAAEQLAERAHKEYARAKIKMAKQLEAAQQKLVLAGKALKVANDANDKLFNEAVELQSKLEATHGAMRLALRDCDEARGRLKKIADAAIAADASHDGSWQERIYYLATEAEDEGGKNDRSEMR